MRMETKRCGKHSSPGTKVVKQARETTAQKSSHQNMRFWRRSTSRAMVIAPETMKKAKAESRAGEGQETWNGRESETLTLEIIQGGRHSGICVDGMDRIGWDGEAMEESNGEFILGSCRRLANKKRSALRFCN